MSDFYQGTLRVMDPAGSLLDIGAAELRIADPDRGAWVGELTIFGGSCLDKKSLTVLVETTDGARSLAQISPSTESVGGPFVKMTIVGLGEAPL